MPPARSNTRLNWPVFEPLLLGREVRLEVVRVNQQRLPEGVMAAVARRLQAQIAGKVRVIDLEPVELPVDKDGWISQPQTQELLAVASCHSPTTIRVIVTPGWGQGLRGMSKQHLKRDSSQTAIVLDGPNIDRFQRKLLVRSKPQTWELVIMHEIYHAINVPLAAERRWDGGHCTHPECILYPRADGRSFLTGLMRLGPPRDLCAACMSEIRKARQAAGQRRIDPDAPYDTMTWFDELVRMNPDKAEAYVVRAAARTEARDWLGLAADLDMAVRLEPDEPKHPNNLAWLLSTCPQGNVRNAKRAVELATRACEMTGWKEAGYLDTLAAACAEARDFAQAVRYQKQAVEINRSDDLAPGLTERLRLYEQGRAYWADPGI